MQENHHYVNWGEVSEQGLLSTSNNELRKLWDGKVCWTTSNGYREISFLLELL